MSDVPIEAFEEPVMSEVAERYAADRFSPPDDSQAPVQEPVAPKAVDSTWGPKPSIKDQLLRKPDSVREGPIRTVVLSIGPDDGKDNVGKAAIDELYARAHGGAPSVVIKYHHTEFHNGVFITLFRYVELEYVQ